MTRRNAAQRRPGAHSPAAPVIFSPMLRAPAPPAAPMLPPEVASLMQAQRWIAERRTTEAQALLGADEAADHPWPDASLQAERRYLLAIAGLSTVPAMPPDDPAERDAVGLRLQRAVADAEAAAGLRPAVARYAFVVGRVYKAAGQLATAEAAYRRALELEPRYAEALVSLGIVRRLQGELEDAIDCHQRALALAPQLSAARANLAVAQAERAEQRIREGFDGFIDDETLDQQGRAVALDVANPVLHRNYGLLLLRARRYREALEAFNETLRLDGTDIEACLRLGSTLASVGQGTLAVEAYERWLERNPPQVPVVRALAGQLTRMGQTDRAIGWAERSVEMERDAYSVIALGSTRMQMRQLRASLDDLREAIELSGRAAPQYPSWLLGLNYLHEDPALIVDAHAEFGTRLPAVTGRVRAGVRPTRLKVGFVSGDFVRHSVSYFIGGLFEHHDRTRFHFTGYHNNSVEDLVTERLKAALDDFVPCEGWSDEALSARIRADRIDVLIDLSGHTSGSRVRVFADGVAPLQMGFLGYPTVSGVPAMDLRLTDRRIDPGDVPAPPGHDRPWPLDRSMFCYRPIEDAPAIAPEPPSLAAGVVTFGSFNNIAKLSDRTLELWAAAMRAVPGSRLLLKANAMGQAGNRAEIEAFMAAQGVSADRLELVAWLPDKDGHLGLYNRVDVGLDPYPYNGATTTCEALWMGVPVVSRRGATHTARMGASVLSAAGCGEWLADTDDAFVRLAAGLAADAAARGEWRRTARQRLMASELFDERGFAAAFERALDSAWDWKAARDAEAESQAEASPTAAIAAAADLPGSTASPTPALAS